MSIIQYNIKPSPKSTDSGDYDRADTIVRIMDDFMTMTAILNQPDINGVIYGGVVRDFFVLETDAKDIDIWFTSLAQAELFVAQLEAAGVEVRITNERPHEKMYPFTVRQINAKFPNNHCYFIDLVVSATYPVNDFDVNDLIWIGTGNIINHYTWDAGVQHYTGDKGKRDQTVNAIKQMIMTMKPGFASTAESEYQASAPRTRIDKFKKRGWTVVETSQSWLSFTPVTTSSCNWIGDNSTYHIQANFFLLISILARLLSSSNDRQTYSESLWVLSL